MKWTRLMHLTGGAFIVVVCMAAFTPIPNIVGRAVSVPSLVQPGDAIVVLAAGITPDGRLVNRSMRRTIYGLRLYKRNLASTIVFSGPAQGGSLSEADERADLAREMGVPDDAILAVNDVNTTYDESRRIASVLAARNLKQILLVTDSLHMRRAKLVFERAGLQVRPAASDDMSSYAITAEERLLLSEEVLLESVGLLYYRLAGYI
jgi:uncharacterized SAM-binding protein YcdF (DUF218 family)